MKREIKENEGIRLLVRKYKALFRIPENVNHYSRADFKVAEKKFLRHAMTERRATL